MSPALKTAFANLLNVLIILIIAAVIVISAHDAADSGSATDALTLDPSPPPKIRIVAQHLIFFEDDRRRAAETENELTAAADDDDDAENDSRQESTLEVIADTPNSAVVLEERLHQESVVHLECAAPYPVEWVYEGEGYPDPLLSFLESKRNAPNYSDPSTYTYSTKLDLVTLSGRNTGRYTCKSSGNGHGSRQAYFYIYVPGKSVFVTDQPALKSKVTPPAPGKEGDGFGLLLPCTVTNPNTTLSLHKINKKSTYLQQIRGATYDPSIGFSFKSPIPWGIYVCITSDKKRLMMAFAKPNRTLAVGTQASRTQFSYDASLQSFLCCVNSSVAREGLKPDMRYIACSSRAECQVRKHAQGSGYKYGEPVPSAVSGRGRVCQAMRATEARKPRQSSGDGSASTSSTSASTSKYRNLISTRERSLGSGGPAGGMFQCRIGTQIDDYYFVWRTSKDANANEPEPVLGLAVSENSDFLEIVFKISSTPVSVSAPRTRPSPSRKSVPRITRGVPIRVECNYNSFLFTKGLVWLFGYENGTSAVVDKQLVATNHYYVEPALASQDSEEERGGLREYTTIVFPDTSITSLICSVPVAPDVAMVAGWRNASREITVVDK